MNQGCGGRDPRKRDGAEGGHDQAIKLIAATQEVMVPYVAEVKSPNLGADRGKAAVTAKASLHPGSAEQLLFQPPVEIGDPFAASDGVDDCVPLIQAVCG